MAPVATPTSRGTSRRPIAGSPTSSEMGCRLHRDAAFWATRGRRQPRKIVSPSSMKRKASVRETAGQSRQQRPTAPRDMYTESRAWDDFCRGMEEARGAPCDAGSADKCSQEDCQSSVRWCLCRPEGHWEAPVRQPVSSSRLFVMHATGRSGFRKWKNCYNRCRRPAKTMVVGAITSTPSKATGINSEDADEPEGEVAEKELRAMAVVSSQSR